MPLTRRAWIKALAAALAAPWPARAEAPADRGEWMLHVQDALLGFDLLEVALRVREGLGLPRRWDRALAELFQGFDTSGGVRRVQALAEDPVFVRRAVRLKERAERDLPLKLRLRRLALQAPEDAAGLVPWIERAAGWVGLDLPGLRAFTEGLPDGLLVIVGPPSELPEIAWSLAREPFVRFLEVVHGRRAREWVAGQPRAELWSALLDPSVRVVVTVGHGLWDELSMRGYPGTPEQIWSDLSRRLRARPKDTLTALFQQNPWALGLATRAAPLRETDLAELVAAWYPDPAAREAAAKDLVVRYTCGSERYRLRPALARDLLPAEIAEALHLAGDRFSPADPRTPPEAWQPALDAWMAGRGVIVEEVPAFGTCLVRDPRHTVGYEGIAWMPDFVADPVPAWAPAWAGVSPRPPPTGG